MKPISLCFYIFFSGNLIAQSIAFYPDDTIYGTTSDDQFAAFDVKIFNITSDSIQLQWVQLENTLLPEWDYSLCDFVTCYPGIPHNGTMQKMSNTDTAFLKISLNPMTMPGSGYVTFQVSPSPGENYFTTIFANVSGTGIEEQDANHSITIFSNPFSEMIYVNDYGDKESYFTMTNMLGEIVLKKKLNHEKNQFSLSAFANGIYIAYVINGHVAETKKIIISR